jgi:hypothetical protein
MIITSNCKRHTNDNCFLATSSIGGGGGRGREDKFFRFLKKIFGIFGNLM